ncbi:MAG TPA: amino acid adenylation domain-containing protein [Bacteroidia bacterium]|jgi:D-alanine--poly(phosphoribitol) ligase subunit 1|nr:amino acid adenylation domain-containing protein [Bacteroidia bacterium]
MKYLFNSKKFVETESNNERIAIAGSDSDITWKQLQEKVTQLEQAFKKLSIPKGHPVIIYGHKEYLFPVAMLACMQSDIPYVPIDKIYPKERIQKIVAATGSQVIINCSADELDIPFPISINKSLQVNVHTTPDYTFAVYGNASDPLQYIMFTSGSTGEPKGVQINQSSVLTFVNWALKDFGFSSTDVFMNQAPFTFDVSLCDVLNAFANGGTLVLNPTELLKDHDAFIQRLTKYKCSVWTSTPSFAYLFLRHEKFNSQHLPALHSFLFMGEELPGRTISVLKNSFKNTRVLNAYGPTEATIVTTFVDVTEELLKKYTSTPIGYPMPQSELLIDKSNADEKQGELIIVGDHVSVGYFKNEELNRSKFFMHNGKRAFRTGDIAYYEDGLLFYMGRNDDQIKMHGFRIELHEIANVICKHELIKDAVAVPLKRGNEVKKIIAFIIPKNQLQEKEELKTQLFPFLEQLLPYYMIPGDILLMNDFAYSSSHKIDKSKLIDLYLKKELM